MRTHEIGIAALLSAALATSPLSMAAAKDSAFMKACADGSPPLSRNMCRCLETELRKVLSPAEFKLEMLAFTGHGDELRRELEGMGADKRASFTSRVSAASDKCPAL
jgi:hypothetical protein